MKIIDLSKLIYSKMPVYEGDPEVKIDLIHTYKKDSWELRKLTLGTHTGTHVDAFSHMHLGKDSIEKISLDNFFGPSQVLSLNDNFPKNKGIFFTEKINSDYLNKIIASKPKFIGGDISENLERELLKNNIITYTDLINLELIDKNKDFIFYGFPLKIKNGDASPVRAIAIID